MYGLSSKKSFLTILFKSDESDDNNIIKPTREPFEYLTGVILHLNETNSLRMLETMPGHEEE